MASQHAMAGFIVKEDATDPADETGWEVLGGGGVWQVPSTTRRHGWESDLQVRSN